MDTMISTQKCRAEALQIAGSEPTNTVAIGLKVLRELAGADRPQNQVCGEPAPPRALPLRNTNAPCASRAAGRRFCSIETTHLNWLIPCSDSALHGPSGPLNFPGTAS